MVDRSDQPLEKPLPSSSDSERSVLGSIMSAGDTLARVVDWLQQNDFADPRHKTLYRVFETLHEAGEPCDMITVCDALERAGLVTDAGGLSYVSGLSTYVLNSELLEHHARILVRKARNRGLVRLAEKLAAWGYNDADPDGACDDALGDLLQVAQRTAGNSDWRSFTQVLNDLADDVLERIESDKFTGIQTSFTALDEAVVGFEPGEVVYLAGRPGSGKSALGLKIAMQGALQCHAEGRGAVHVVTLEMSARQQARRLVSDRSEMNTRYIRVGFRTPGRDPDLDAWARFDEQRMWLQERVGERLWFQDAMISMTQLRAQVTRAVRQHGCRLVVIDQLDLFAESGRDEYERITKMSRQLKQIAKSCGAAILCMVQLSRKCEERRNKRPILSDLRQSGQLEQDADMVWGLYRPAYYDAERARADAKFQQFAELLVLKARDGASGMTVPLWFQAEYTRFRDWPFGDVPADPTRDVQE